MVNNLLKLCFIRYIGKTSDNKNIYEFFFTENEDDFWGENFEYMPCGLCNDITPNEDAYSKIYTIETDIKLCIITDSCCFSMQDCLDGVVALGWQDLSVLEEYPDEGRLILNFGDSYNDIETQLAERNILMTEKVQN